MHYLLKELMAIDTYFYESIDNPDEMQALADRISPFLRNIFHTVAESPAELILSGANYDSAITIPSMFKEHIVPELKYQSDYLHKKGKFLVTHTDGENIGLLKLYVESGFDVADSICPFPMTKYTLKETRDAFGKDITIWGGIASISVVESCMNDYEFDEYINELLESIGSSDHIIFSVADTVPATAKFERILEIAQKVKEFGPIRT